MDRKAIGEVRWFRAAVGVLTLLSGVALFALAGLSIHSFVSALIAFLCLMGLERLYSGLLGMFVALLLRRRRPERS